MRETTERDCLTAAGHRGSQGAVGHKGNMASSVWKGQISFGLVTIPVRLLRAADLQGDPDADELGVAPAADRGGTGELATPVVDHAALGEALEERVGVVGVGGGERGADGWREGHRAQFTAAAGGRQ